MSSWRAHFGFTKYISVAARATRQALKEDARIKADARSNTNLRYQEWEAGKAGDNVWMKPQVEEVHKPAATP